MAKEYIERDKVLSHKWEVRSYDPSDPDPVTEVVSVSSIMCVPTADVVPVVRCRECKYRAEDDFCIGRGWPDRLVADDGFCEKGKRKDGGQDE